MVSRKLDYSGVPSGELENNGSQKKYTINRSPKGDLLISKPICALMTIGAILLAVLAALLVFMLMPRCGEATPEALVKLEKEKADSIDEMLPKSIQPLHYRVQLIPNLNIENPTTNGAVAISLNVTEATDKIVLHAVDLDVDQKSTTLNRLIDDKSIKITAQSYDKETQQFTVSLGETLSVNDTFNLDLKFTGKLNDKMQGFYLSNYKEGGRTKTMASTQFSPTDARRAFPCFDEPSFKARFTVSIARPENMTSISNMPLRERALADLNKKNWVWDNYEETPLMSTYLVAFVVSDLQQFKYNSSEKMFTVWCRRDALDQARYGLNMAPKLLQFYESYFNINFPLPKIDLVAVPDFGFSAMENWGLITFREKILLVDEKSASVLNKRETATVMGHEIAHQWFGNLVTPKWWNDLWLKEGFANYLGFLGVHQVEPTWNIMDEFVTEHTYEAFKIDSFESTRPVSSDVHNNIQIRQQFDGISYAKGAALIRMMNHFLGEERFKQGLINYLNKYRYENADREDLWESFAEDGGSVPENASLADVMNSWILQPGLPVVIVSGNVSAQSISIKQRRFLMSGELKTGNWWIPISLASDFTPALTQTAPKIWLRNDSDVTSVDVRYRNWYLLNLEQTGYYIVNYDEPNWKALISHVMSFTPNIRSQLISDSMDLARANMLSYDIPLRFISEMARNDMNITFLPFLTAFQKLGFLHDILYKTSTYGNFNVFLQNVFTHAFTNVYFDVIPPSDYFVYVKERIQRIILRWACKHSESRCVTKARFMYRTWMMDKTEVPANVREIVYCTAIREGSEVEWNFAREKYLEATSWSEKEVLLKAMGCTSKPWLLSQYLEYTLRNDTGIRKQDGAKVFEAVASNPVGHQLAFNFLRDKWNALRDYYGDGFKILGKMASALPKYMNTPFELEELEKFQKVNLNNLGTAEQSVERVIEIVKANVMWMKQSHKAVDEWLKDFNRHFVF